MEVIIAVINGREVLTQRVRRKEKRSEWRIWSESRGNEMRRRWKEGICRFGRSVDERTGEVMIVSERPGEMEMEVSRDQRP